MLITSLTNPKIKHIVRLRERRARDKAGEFLIEGYRELSRAVTGGQAITDLYICPQLFLGSNENKLIDAIKGTGAEIFKCHESVFQKMSYRDRPDGLIGVAKQNLQTLKDIPQSATSPFYIVAEAVEKPGNLGTILRSSDAVDVDGLILCDKCTDIYNPNVVRASVGTLFTVPFYEATTEETIPWLKEQGIHILAATPSATHDYTQVDLTVPLAIAVGTEQYGLSDRWMNEADLQVKIPMRGVADSLNVAMATTVLLYEVLRQRS